MKITGWPARVLAEIGVVIFQIYARTIRFEINDSLGVAKILHERPVIVGVWHNRLLLLLSLFDRRLGHPATVALISASRDGDLIATLVHRFRFGTIRGSTSRKGVIALRESIETLARGTHVLVTPDGPRGPVYELGQGIIFVAQKSGAPVLPLALEFSSCWRLKSWDRFFVPKPFSKVRANFGALHEVSQTTNPAEFERERLRLQSAMVNLVEEK